MSSDGSDVVLKPINRIHLRRPIPNTDRHRHHAVPLRWRRTASMGKVGRELCFCLFVDHCSLSTILHIHSASLAPIMRLQPVSIPCGGTALPRRLSSSRFLSPTSQHGPHQLLSDPLLKSHGMELYPLLQLGQAAMVPRLVFPSRASQTLISQVALPVASSLQRSQFPFSRTIYNQACHTKGRLSVLIPYQGGFGCSWLYFLFSTQRQDRAQALVRLRRPPSIPN